MPTYNSTNSLAEQLMKGTSASPATAFAKSVLPVPGRPTCKKMRGALTHDNSKSKGRKKKKQSKIETHPHYECSINAYVINYNLEGKGIGQDSLPLNGPSGPFKNQQVKIQRKIEEYYPSIQLILPPRKKLQFHLVMHIDIPVRK